MTDAATTETGSPEGLAEEMEVLGFLPPAQARRLAAVGRVRRVPAGETLMGPEQEADFMAFVLDGKLAVKKPASFPGRFILLAEIEAGGLVGEGVVVGPAVGSRTLVEAAADSRLLVIPRPRLLPLLDQDPELARRLLVRIIGVLRQRLGGAGERLAWIL